MVSVTEGKSILLEKTTSNNAEENHSEYESRVQKLRIESVALNLHVHRIECCAEETFKEADLTLECIWMHHHY